MAHSKKFSENDIKSTMEFIGSLENQIAGDKVLDICGGMSRCQGILSSLFNTIDVFDLIPSFNDTPLDKRGRLIKSNLKDIGQHISGQ